MVASRFDERNLSRRAARAEETAEKEETFTSSVPNVSTRFCIFNTNASLRRNEAVMEKGISDAGKMALM